MRAGSLPDTPELIGDLLNWHPTTYQLNAEWHLSFPRVG